MWQVGNFNSSIYTSPTNPITSINQLKNLNLPLSLFFVTKGRKKGRSCERFENKQIDYKGIDLGFAPSGVGRRGCPGGTFGLASIEVRGGGCRRSRRGLRRRRLVAPVDNDGDE